MLMQAPVYSVPYLVYQGQDVMCISQAERGVWIHCTQAMR